MARKVKISVLSGHRPNQYNGEMKVDLAIKAMKDYWTNELQQAVNEKSDVVLLPEACDRFLDLEPSFAKEFHETKIHIMPEFFAKYAKEHKITIVYSGKLEKTNSSVVFDQDGNTVSTYDKVFPMIEEINVGIIPGTDAIISSFNNIKKAGFAICFDLNFDELRQQYIDLGSEVIFFSSMFHGGFQQELWAYSTRSFFVSSIFGKQSRIMAPNGSILASTSNYNTHCSAVVNLDSVLVHLDHNNNKLPAIKKKYGDKIIVDDTGYLGSIMIYNELEDRTINDIVKEFKLELLDDYFNRSRDYISNFLKSID
ncbi:MAG: carbon-nitrogen hydrolase family protein [Clostridiales bacterium]|nr:carbon-nitrogen hydrolase family protein [Clostridiales bacterium]